MCLSFHYVCRLSITHNGFHNGGRAAEARPPTVVEAASIMRDGEAANMAKANTYTI